ncbi:hypothetical protein KIPB_005750 [Kipferlia bialata]|uniref:Uncharacterized protein n=1 Tax=Kipferlia bialata TaxID=797122 RepID=A0A391NQ38_9EUKA|nr:hypothetical protein KIPB_003154 [Kipferlia bialata]GCA62776.1 hypothetical protein KIPB_005750 [Kipferlia bialata]|eukprot:g3154.t1
MQFSQGWMGPAVDQGQAGRQVQPHFGHAYPGNPRPVSHDLGQQHEWPQAPRQAMRDPRSHPHQQPQAVSGMWQGGQRVSGREREAYPPVPTQMSQMPPFPPHTMYGGAQFQYPQQYAMRSYPQGQPVPQRVYPSSVPAGFGRGFTPVPQQLAQQAQMAQLPPRYPYSGDGMQRPTGRMSTGHGQPQPQGYMPYGSVPAPAPVRAPSPPVQARQVAAPQAASDSAAASFALNLAMPDSTGYESGREDGILSARSGHSLSSAGDSSAPDAGSPELMLPDFLSMPPPSLTPSRGRDYGGDTKGETPSAFYNPFDGRPRAGSEIVRSSEPMYGDGTGSGGSDFSLDLSLPSIFSGSISQPGSSRGQKQRSVRDTHPAPFASARGTRPPPQAGATVVGGEQGARRASDSMHVPYTHGLSQEAMRPCLKEGVYSTLDDAQEEDQPADLDTGEDPQVSSPLAVDTVPVVPNCGSGGSHSKASEAETDLPLLKWIRWAREGPGEK